MAYTYDEFLNAANSSGVMDKFSQQDLTVAQKNPEYGLSMVSLLKDITGATTEEQRLLATEAANQLRKNYGVYNAGGTYASSYGSQINDLLGKVNNYGSFTYDNENAYQQLLTSIINQEDFNYDHTQDSSYSALKKSFLREGERASANALAQASAANGGQVSSYATQAAQQAGQYYAGQLADIIPTLEQNAYQRYLSDLSNRMGTLNSLQSDRAQAQDSWLNQYNILLNNLNSLQQQEATDYQRYLEQVSQQQAAEQLAYERARQEEQLAYERAKAQYNLLGYATPEIAEILGIPAPVVEEPVEEIENQHANPPVIDERAAQIAELQSRYPNRIITDPYVWSGLLYSYDEDVLRDAGIYYQQAKPKATATGGGGTLGAMMVRA